MLLKVHADFGFAWVSPSSHTLPKAVLLFLSAGTTLPSLVFHLMHCLLSIRFKLACAGYSEAFTFNVKLSFFLWEMDQLCGTLFSDSLKVPGFISILVWNLPIYQKIHGFRSCDQYFSKMPCLCDVGYYWKIHVPKLNKKSTKIIKVTKKKEKKLRKQCGSVVEAVANIRVK